MSVLVFEILASTEGDEVLHHVTPAGDIAVLGTSPAADVVVAGPGVAREHALVLVGRASVTVRTTSPAAATVVERGPERTVLDDRRARCALQDGDVLRLGESGAAPRIRVRLAREPEPEHLLEVRDLASLAGTPPPAGRQEALLRALRDLEAAVAASSGLQAVLTAIADASLEVVGRATHATLVLRQPDEDPDGAYVPALTRQRGADGRSQTPAAPVRLARSVFRKVVRDASAVLAADAMDSDLSSESLLGAGIMSTIGIPLWKGSQVFGVLQVDSRDAPAMFDATDVDALAVFAASAALAIVNARLIARLEAAEDQLSSENRYLRGRDRDRRSRVSPMVGESASLRELLSQVEKVAATRAAVLIEGETGTGKELIASAVHERSPRRSALFVAQNCAALPEQLLESELFGHKRGAFTGATEEKKGLFEIADGGTLFLDEIGEMPPPLQAKLLRVLQEGEIRRVGAAHPQRVDVRIVSATNRDLEREVREGRFREDLFYRLAVFPLKVPALRERPGDVRLLAEHFLDRYRKELGKPIAGLAPETLDLLDAYEWPGNVRELDNEIQRLVIQADPGAILTPDLLSPRVRKMDRLAAAAGVSTGSLRGMMDQIERHLLLEALKAHDQNKTSAARALGITREGLHKKLRQLGIG
jgi:transcriptional regulator with GAF, ATPase, and Fis domain